MRPRGPAAGGRRPTALERRRRQARVVAVVIALALVAAIVLPLAALASPQPAGAGAEVPPEVAAVLGPDVGTVHEVRLWATGYLQGDPAAATAEGAVETAETWVAAVLDGTQVVGTRTAWRDPAQDGAVALAAEDADVGVGDALESLAAGSVLVTDQGEWLVVEPAAGTAAGATVRSLLPDRFASVPEAVPLDEHQVQRAVQYAADLDAARRDPSLAGGGGAEDAGTGGASSRTAFVVGGAALLTALAVLVVVRSRRQAATGSSSPA